MSNRTPLVIEYVSPEALKPNAYNPNLHDARSFDLLLDSLRMFGFVAPIIALQDGTIIDGEHRWRAAMVLDLSEVPVCIIPQPTNVKLLTVLCNRARGAEDREMVEAIKAETDGKTFRDERWDTLHGRR